jgi:hypothetical protein
VTVESAGPAAKSRHHHLCWSYAASLAAENGAEGPEQEDEWADEYLANGVVECRCSEYMSHHRYVRHWDKRPGCAVCGLVQKDPIHHATAKETP